MPGVIRRRWALPRQGVDPEGGGSQHVRRHHVPYDDVPVITETAKLFDVPHAATVGRDAYSGDRFTGPR
ncbi:hypothetical protein Cs7R123_30030 [Catellatospora sp. TT07R-123]|nr:hypothetical protein Cs7R123_30030 [Catellatospora sp. TT07R-123]